MIPDKFATETRGNWLFAGESLLEVSADVSLAGPDLVPSEVVLLESRIRRISLNKWI